MDFSKIKNKMLIILCIFVVLLPFFLITFTYASENDTVSTSTVYSLAFDSHTNHFVTVSGRTVGYFQLEKGYIYNITETYATTAYLGLSSDIPDANVPVDYLASISQDETYSYAVYDNNTYLCFAFSNAAGVTVTREKIPGMNSTISELVDNVGINQVWTVFNNAIPYIGVVALFVFGFVIITYLYLKISKGKAGF